MLDTSKVRRPPTSVFTPARRGCSRLVRQSAIATATGSRTAAIRFPIRPTLTRRDTTVPAMRGAATNQVAAQIPVAAPTQEAAVAMVAAAEATNHCCCRRVSNRLMNQSGSRR